MVSWYNKYRKFTLHKEPAKPRNKAACNHLIAYVPHFPFISRVWALGMIERERFFSIASNMCSRSLLPAKIWSFTSLKLRKSHIHIFHFLRHFSSQLGCKLGIKMTKEATVMKSAHSEEPDFLTWLLRNPFWERANWIGTPDNEIISVLWPMTVSRERHSCKTKVKILLLHMWVVWVSYLENSHRAYVGVCTSPLF